VIIAGQVAQFDADTASASYHTSRSGGRVDGKLRKSCWPAFRVLLSGAAGIALAGALIAAGPANQATTLPAATTRAAAIAPVPPVVSSPLDAEEIQRGPAPGTTGAAAGQAGGSAAGTAGSPVGLLQVTLALLGVLGLILAMKIAMRWLWPGAASQRASRSVRVIARTPLGSRSALVLVQVGKRLVVVGDCGAQLSPICEITDPDEVAGMLGAIQSERLGSASRRFAVSLGRAQADFEEADGQTLAESTADPATEPAAEPSSDSSLEPAEPEALANTRQELRGLASRVRTLAERYRKPSP